MQTPSAFQRLYEIIGTLRGTNGCPWDREQTPESLRGNLLEETYETIEAIDSGNARDIEEELGDVYLLITMIGVIFEERGSFSVASVLETICEKLIRRHPHVFGDSAVSTTAEVTNQWNRIKVEQEGKREKDQHLDAVSSALPPLERAYRLQERAAKVGFDWPDVSGVLEKLHEEIDEVLAELPGSEERSPALESEVGDLLFSAVNVARYLRVDPSVALHGANQKFVRRFGAVEAGLRAAGTNLANASLDEMDRLWTDAKHRDEGP